MSVYFVAQISVHDPAEYQRYLDACDQVFARFNGTYLAVDDSPTLLEGNRPDSRVVMIRFPCEADLLSWYNSEEYQQILKHRLAGASCTTIVVHGGEGDR